MVTTAEQHREGETAVGPNGERAVFSGGQWVVQPAPRAASPVAGVPGLIQMETPAQRVQAEERAYDRQRDIVRDDRADRTEQRAIEAASRSADVAERTAEKLTEDQGKSGGYTRLMADAEASYQQALREGFNPTGFMAGLANFTDNVPLMGGVGNFLRDDAGDRARQAELQWTDAQLKAMSGAASPEQEVTRNNITFFARPGQDYSYLGERLGQARETAFDSAKLRAGPAGRDVSYPEGGGVSQSGPIDPATNLPTYPGVAALAGGITDAPLPEGGYGPRPGDVVTTSQPLTEEEARNPNVLSAQGYVYDPGSDTWRRARQEVAPEQRGWTPESAVAQRRDMNPVLRGADAVARGFADATSLEFADEIAAGGDSLFGQGVGSNMGERFRNNLRVQQALDAADGQDVGALRNAGEIAGYGSAALVAGPRLLASAGRNIVSPLLRGAVTGVRNALGGGAVAATAAAGQENGNILERAQAGLKAAPVGAALGVALPAGLALGGAADRFLGAPVARAADAVARPVQRVVGGIGERLGVNGASALRARSTPNALRSAVEQFSERMGPGRISSLEQNAARQRGMGFDPTLADVVDDAGQGSLRALATMDTAARPAAVRFGRQRRADAQGDVSDLARRFVSDDPRSASRVAADLEDAQRLASGPAYDAARASPPITVTADVGEALFSGEGPATLRSAARAYRSSVAPQERALALELDSLARAADEGMPAGQVEMSVGAADLLSRYLGKAGGADANLSRIYQGLGREIRNQARAQSPAYEAALSGFAERAQLDDAAEFGAGFLSRRGTQDFSERAERLLPAQRDVARVAARDAIEDAGSTTSGAATLLDDLSIGQGRGQRTDALIGENAIPLRETADAARDRLMAGRNVDPRMGSNTNLNSRDSENVENAVEFLSDGAQIVSRPISGTIAVLGRRFQNRGFSKPEAEELVLASLDPARTQELISMLSQRMSRREARSLARAITRSVTSGTGSGSVQ